MPPRLKDKVGAKHEFHIGWKTEKRKKISEKTEIGEKYMLQIGFGTESRGERAWRLGFANEGRRETPLALMLLAPYIVTTIYMRPLSGGRIHKLLQ